jgi:hypothetical protein
VDASGNADVTGWTRATDFPTKNPIQAAKGSGENTYGVPVSNVFVTTLNSTGSGLLFSTYLGGSGGSFTKKGTFTGSDGDVWGYALALDAAGNVYVTGLIGYAPGATPTTFPTTPGAYQTTPGGYGFVFMIDPPAGGATASPATEPAGLATPGGSTTLGAAPAPIAWALLVPPTQVPLPAAPAVGPDALPAPRFGAASPVLGMAPKQPGESMDSVSVSDPSLDALDQLFAEFGPGLSRGLPGNALAPIDLA